MIEAVNSVVSNAPLLRGNAEQVSSARASSTESVTPSPQAPFVSPYISVDFNFDTAVLQIRDSDTGDVVRQFPSQSALQARQRAQVVQDAVIFQAQEDTSSGDSSTGSAGGAVPSQPQTVEAPPPSQAAEAQVAAQALSAGAQTGQAGDTGSVSVVA